MHSEFGKAMKALRAQRGIMLRELACRVGRSVAFLSAVEHGRKRVPHKLVDDIIGALALDAAEAAALHRAARSANEQALRLTVSGVDGDTRAVLFAVARSFDRLAAEERDAIVRILARLEPALVDVVASVPAEVAVVPAGPGGS